MADGKLHWERCNGGIRFQLVDPEGRAVPVTKWGLYTVRTQRGPGSVAHLLALHQDGLVAHPDEDSLQVPDSQIAAMDALGLRRLGLPGPADARLRLVPHGALASPAFRLRYQLVGPDGIPLMGVRREGALLEAGSATHTLLDPLYTIVERIDAFNEDPPASVDGRFLFWADIKALLPDGTELTTPLAEMEIVRADAFTFDWSQEDGLIPVPIGAARDAPGDGANPPEPLLAPEALRAFVDRLDALQEGHLRYALGRGRFLVLGQRVARAMALVRGYRTRPLSEQRAFLANPVGVLKEHLGDELPDDALEVLFQETPVYVSARIAGLGEWQPKLCAYVMPSGQQWLPPEERILSVPVGSAVVQLPAGRVDEAIAAVESAIKRGDSSAEVAGVHVPATPAALEALRRLGRPSVADGDRPARREPEAPLVPQIIDNLEDVGFERPASARKIVGQVGGIPQALGTVLLPHQREGVEWLQQHWASGSSGALLADDMGLGKTLQALAFMTWVQEQVHEGGHERRPFLVVAPTGLLRNWEAEAQQHLRPPGLGLAMRAYGASLRELAATMRLERHQRLTGADWVLTTYETLRDRIDVFAGLRWRVLVLDEAQKIKNPAARVTDMVKAVDAEFTIALTGTPVENQLADLWSIVDAVQPGRLGALRAFHQQYERPAREDPKRGEDLAAFLQQTTCPPLMLRRFKEEHLKGLPEKRTSRHERRMPAEQAEAYSAAVDAAMARAGERGAMLEALHELRRVSLLTAPIGASGLGEADIARSARLSAAFDVLDQIAERGEKALIFVDYLDLQDALIPYLQKRYGLPEPPSKISGQVAGARRKRLVDVFQAIEQGRFAVMLLSPRAGGVGLTLTAANHVIHLSRWWNPAVEDQCTDRVYRIGQTRAVHVHLPIALHPRYPEHSFDQNLDRLLERKRALSRTVLAPPVARDEDLKELFDGTVNVSM